MLCVYIYIYMSIYQNVRALWFLQTGEIISTMMISICYCDHLNDCLAHISSPSSCVLGKAHFPTPLTLGRTMWPCFGKCKFHGHDRSKNLRVPVHVGLALVFLLSMRITCCGRPLVQAYAYVKQTRAGPIAWILITSLKSSLVQSRCRQLVGGKETLVMLRHCVWGWFVTEHYYSKSWLPHYCIK